MIVPGARVDGDGDRRAVGRAPAESAATRLVDVDVVLVLPAVAVEPLPEVALVVVEPDADERNAEVGGALDVIAGQNAEAARIDRQRLVQPELGGEVRDRPRPQHAGVARAPRVLRRAGIPASGGRRS